MDPISTVNQVMALLRQQLADRYRGKKLAQSDTQETAAGSATAQTGDASPRMRDAVRHRITELRMSGVDNERQLVRVAIEMLMTREFGVAVANDPEFQHAVNWVLQCFDEDPEMHGLLREFLGDR
ncbi:hypothetical protein [Burkholderia cepacia]|uniref:hypothetical protein n=1 Tax=Burkholderia cepacia TaxID=292 RepID=UPI0012D2ED17|nr:hypothetical protein [Burkholderia cepacia]